MANANCTKTKGRKKNEEPFSDRVIVCLLFPLTSTLISVAFILIYLFMYFCEFKTASIHAHSNNWQNNHIFFRQIKVHFHFVSPATPFIFFFFFGHRLVEIKQKWDTDIRQKRTISFNDGSNKIKGLRSFLLLWRRKLFIRFPFF